VGTREGQGCTPLDGLACSAPVLRRARRPLPTATSLRASAQCAPPLPLCQAPVVPESILKKRKRQEAWDEAKKAEAAAAQTSGAEKKAEAFKRAEAYVAEYKSQQESLVTLKRAARAKGTFYVEPEPKLLFVMRLRGINGMHPKTRHIMKVLRLLQIHNGVFMKVNKATMNNLVKVDPYIMYGYPTLKTVRDLIYKRGFAKVGVSPSKQRVPITDNKLIEDNLSKATDGNVICIEDIVHQIYTCGPYFKECSKFLWPFKMNSPVGGFSRIRHHFVEGGDAGNREEYINDLIKRML
jgi:large subunit ribosomal protein L7e